MGLLSGLLGNASEIDTKKLDGELDEILVSGEQLERGYKLVRDLLVFTNKRIVMIDKQGITGSKRETTSIPYGSVVKFSKETAGHFDMDAELRVWVRSSATPVVWEFKGGKDIHEVYRVLSAYIL